MNSELFNLFELCRDKLKNVLVYQAIETIDDPYEKTTSKTMLNPIPVKAIVRTISPDALRWKYTGQLSSGSKEIICEKKYLNLFKMADKIKIDDNYYKCYQDDERGFNITDKTDYLIIIVQLKVGNINV